MTKRKARNGKKVKDPYAIIRRKEKGKNFEQKPTDDTECIPKKLKSLMEWTNDDTKTMRRKRKPSSKNGFSTKCLVDNVDSIEGMTRPLKPVPVFKQSLNESDKKFVNRVNKITNERIQESKFEDKFDVDVVRNPSTGEIKMVSRSGNTKKERKKKKMKLKQQEEKDKSLNTTQQDQKSENADDFAHLRDTVVFGDIVHHPPNITALPRKADNIRSSQTRDKSLLLHKLVKPKTISLKSRAVMDQERQQAVAAYRTLKAMKIQTRASKQF